jgi:hypothetical protein
VQCIALVFDRKSRDLGLLGSGLEFRNWRYLDLGLLGLGLEFRNWRYLDLGLLSGT